MIMVFYTFPYNLGSNRVAKKSAFAMYFTPLLFLLKNAVWSKLAGHAYPG